MLSSLALVLALASGYVVEGRSVASGPASASYEDLLSEGEAHFEAQAFVDAAESFTRAYDAMPPAIKTSELGAATVLNWLVPARRKAWLETEQIDHIERARETVQAFVSAQQEAALSDPAIVVSVEARGELEKLEAILARHAAATPPLPSAISAPTSTPSVVAAPPTSTTTPPRPDAPLRSDGRRKTGIVLLSVGSAVVVGGLGLVVGGEVTRKDAKETNAQAMELGRNYDLDRNLRKANASTGSGVALAAIGVGLAITGAILLVRHPRRTIALVSRLGARHMGAAVVGRF